MDTAVLVRGIDTWEERSAVKDFVRCYASPTSSPPPGLTRHLLVVASAAEAQRGKAAKVDG